MIQNNAEVAEPRLLMGTWLVLTHLLAPSLPKGVSVVGFTLHPKSE